MTAARLRPARPDDLDDVLAIERASFGDPWTRDAFASFLAHPAIRFTIAVQGATVVGYAIAMGGADEVDLANLAVLPTMRGAGIGRQLVEAVLRDAAVARATAVYLEVRASNVAAQALYRRCGFAEVGRRKGYYDHPREDAVVMRCAVPATAGAPPGAPPVRPPGATDR